MTGYDVVVVGAGWAGMMALHHARQIRLAAHLLEAEPEVGGTWYRNRYPGLRCDIESIHYSYSFDEQLQQEWTWSERYAAQPELLAYARHVAERFDLHKDMSLSTRVDAMAFDQETDTWSITTSTDRTIRARWVIMATGALSVPKSVTIPGRRAFSGEEYETANWPSAPVDLTGKRVAVIGTGSSGIQVSTAIAGDVEHLYVLQRTPSYSAPARNRPLAPDESRRVKSDYAALRESNRRSLDGLALPSTGKPALEVTSEDRQREYDAIYQDGRPFRFLQAFTDVILDAKANADVAEYLAATIRARVHDPAVAEHLVPRGYPVGTRRICLDNGYYEIFNQDNVTLVDLLEDPIDQIVARGIRTRSGTEIRVDAIIYATGYDAFSGALDAVDIAGTAGQSLRATWADGAKSYLGLMIAGFPNLFTITGPQSPSVLSNMFVSIEQHVGWVADCLGFLRDCGATRIEASPGAQEEWTRTAAELADATLHRLGRSWYTGENVPGKPRVILPYVGGVGQYRLICDQVAANGYEGFTITAPAAADDHVARAS